MNTYYSMVPKLVYAFRGWIAFVAFMDFGTMIRCFIEKRSHLGGHIYAVDGESQYDNPTLARIVGVYSLLKALALIHCTLYIHYKPVRNRGICVLFITIVMYYAETFYFYTTTLNFYILFPCVLNGPLTYLLPALEGVHNPGFGKSWRLQNCDVTGMKDCERNYQKPPFFIKVRSLGICALFITIVMYYAETFYFYTTALSFYILFPCVLNAITLVGLLLIPKYLEPPVVAEDENMELLKQAAALRKRRAKKNA